MGFILEEESVPFFFFKYIPIMKTCLISLKRSLFLGYTLTSMRKGTSDFRNFRNTFIFLWLL